MRNVDISGRYGGEEFLVILPEVQLKGAVILAERIREKVEKIETDAPGLKITVSGGVAEYIGGDIEELVKKADQLLYKAKESGKELFTVLACFEKPPADLSCFQPAR